MVSMRTTDGATRSTAARKACDSISSRSAAAHTATGANAESKRASKAADLITYVVTIGGDAIACLRTCFNRETWRRARMPILQPLYEPTL